MRQRAGPEGLARRLAGVRAKRGEVARVATRDNSGRAVVAAAVIGATATVVGAFVATRTDSGNGIDPNGTGSNAVRNGAEGIAQGISSIRVDLDLAEVTVGGSADPALIDEVFVMVGPRPEGGFWAESARPSDDGAWTATVAVDAPVPTGIEASATFVVAPKFSDNELPATTPPSDDP